jgi:hypothetical protein
MSTHTARTVKLPGPDHPITIERHSGTVGISVAGERSANAVWTYENPYPAVEQIKGHLAFYPDRVDAIDEANTSSSTQSPANLARNTV